MSKGMKNQLLLKITMKNDKTQKKGNWEIRIENLLKEYFNIESYEYSWNPNYELSFNDSELKAMIKAINFSLDGAWLDLMNENEVYFLRSAKGKVERCL